MTSEEIKDSVSMRDVLQHCGLPSLPCGSVD